MYSSLPNRQEQQALAAAVGERLKEAREMVGLNQLQAAKHMGYANSTKLSKIESGKHSSQIPMWVIKRASQLYDVSADYLLGVTETMERNEKTGNGQAQHTEMMIHMREDWDRLRGRDIAVMAALNTRIGRLEQGVHHLDDVATTALTAMRRVIEINPKWQAIRGGQRLVDAVESTAYAARNARQELRIVKKASLNTSLAPQLDLVFV